MEKLKSSFERWSTKTTPCALAPIDASDERSVWIELLLVGPTLENILRDGTSDGTMHVPDTMHTARVGAAVTKAPLLGHGFRQCQRSERHGRHGSFTLCLETAFHTAILPPNWQPSRLLQNRPLRLDCWVPGSSSARRGFHQRGRHHAH